MDRIQVEHLGKRYRIGERHNVRESLSMLASRRSKPAASFWSLRDVTFAVADGESVGIVGRNGAGKSTLLKLLMRITSPTEGVARTRGRAAALLEVGTGFHPELTGRENIFLNAAVLGMSRSDTVRRFDEIVAFAGTERFLDTPVKRYSSGMYLRLAFAVAAHLDPDILIVDEVLAVGDAEFQRKCLTRMSAAEREGRTVVFVSHDLHSLARLCQRTIWLESGQLRDDGATDVVVKAYLRSGATPDSAATLRDTSTPLDVPVRLLATRARALEHDDDQPLLRDDPFEITVDFELRDEQVGLDIAVYVLNARGVRIFDELMSDSLVERFDRGRHRIALDVPPVLSVGTYTIGVWVGTSTSTLLDVAVAGAFELLGSDRKRVERAVVLDLPFRREA